MLFSDERISLEDEESAETESYDEEALHMRQLLKTKLHDMDLSVRALNCLKAAEVDTLGDLVTYSKSDLMKFRNFGKKSLNEIKEKLVELGLGLGMNIDPSLLTGALPSVAAPRLGTEDEATVGLADLIAQNLND